MTAASESSTSLALALVFMSATVLALNCSHFRVPAVLDVFLHSLPPLNV